MNGSMLDGTRSYFSGPMDFVGSRVVEKYLGWRAILTPIARALGIRVLDPWNKPVVRGHDNYGQEGVIHSKAQYETDFWTNGKTRAHFETDFWATVHIDLRMTDLADFVISFVPTNIYSVGTVHEIVVARGQHKPVLLISPPIKYDFFPEVADLSPKTRNRLKFYGLKENPSGIPSQWYGTIVGGQNMFDGFGWEGLPFKSPDFYPSLIDTVLDNAKPHESDDAETESWRKVREWVDGYAPLRELSGSILDNISFPDESERRLLDEALAHPAEKRRQYFWYNTPYTPKRPMLYQFLKIASGQIPPRLHVVPHLDPDGNATYSSFECADDNWLLISHAEDQQPAERG